MSEVAGLYEKIVTGLLGALGVLVGVIFKNLTGKVKNLEESKLDKEVFKDHAEAVLEELKSSRKERREDFKSLSESISHIQERLNERH